MAGVLDFSKIFLRGVSQVMLQNNALTGLLFLLGILYNSWLMCIGAILGCIISTLTAFILGYKTKDIKDGLYGFNGTLVGIALLFFFKLSALLVIFLFAGSVLSSIVMNLMHRKRLSPYTFPFVLSTWLIILVNFLGILQQNNAGLLESSKLDLISSLSMGFGQVMFQASIITGIIFLLAILVNSWKSAVYAFGGSLLGILVSVIFSFPANLVNMGLFGFNGVLCGIAFADDRKNSSLYAAASAMISVFIMYAMISFNLAALTSPFVFSTWIMLAVRKAATKKSGKKRK